MIVDMPVDPVLAGGIRTVRPLPEGVTSISDATHGTLSVVSSGQYSCVLAVSARARYEGLDGLIVVPPKIFVNDEPDITFILRLHASSYSCTINLPL